MSCASDFAWAHSGRAPAVVAHYGSFAFFERIEVLKEVGVITDHEDDWEVSQETYWFCDGSRVLIDTMNGGMRAFGRPGSEFHECECGNEYAPRLWTACPVCGKAAKP